jgi:hypothetical protein
MIMAATKGRAPRIGKRALDALFVDVPRERRRQFFERAYRILGKSFEEIEEDHDGTWGIAAPKFREDRLLTVVKCMSELASLAERADKREEPFRKLAAVFDGSYSERIVNITIVGPSDRDKLTE